MMNPTSAKILDGMLGTNISSGLKDMEKEKKKAKKRVKKQQTPIYPQVPPQVIIQQPMQPPQPQPVYQQQPIPPQPQPVYNAQPFPQPQTNQAINQAQQYQNPAHSGVDPRTQQQTTVPPPTKPAKKTSKNSITKKVAAQEVYTWIGKLKNTCIISIIFMVICSLVSVYSMLIGTIVLAIGVTGIVWQLWNALKMYNYLKGTYNFN